MFLNKIAFLLCVCLVTTGTNVVGQGAFDAGGSWWGEPIPMSIPPWTSEYKLKPGDRDKLTAADVVGPDGVVYPNWKHVGVEGGIPDVAVALKLERLGARPETDISEALEKACAEVGAKGGAILIGKGVYYLDRPITVRNSGVVIRGSGRDDTRLVFRYSIVNPQAKLPAGWPGPSVFTFRGGHLDERERFLAADGKRGDSILKLKESDGLNVGDHFVLRAPVTKRWQAITRDRSAGAWGVRTNQYKIRAINGNVIDIGEPLRIDYPVADGSSIRTMKPIQYSGLERMTIEHACRMGFDTLTSLWAWNCWARDLNVIDAGCSGVHFRGAKRCEVRDSEFTGFDAKVHRANENWWGYAGFTQSVDCLIDNTVWRRFRHGPQVQFGAQGNVIRNSTFEGSDAQWHAGWSTENLFENCRIGPTGPYGSYGFGMYSTPSHDTSHGPNGPRNVVYNCDVTSGKDGVYARGASENWLFLHNRFAVNQGSGFHADSGFFDAILRNNVFLLTDGKSPLLFLRTPDCVGIELVGNRLYGGSGKIVEGATKVAVDENNKALPAPKDGVPERPVANPPSIYDWQQKKKSK